MPKLDDFRGKCFNIRGNLLVKLLAIQRLTDRTPFEGNVDMNGRTFDLHELEAVRATERTLQIRITELAGDMTRSVIDDTWRVYERYLTELYAHAQGLPQPEFDAQARSPNEFLKRFASCVTDDERAFLDFFAKVRHSLVHFEGRCSKRQVIDYIFKGVAIRTQGLEGQPLPINLGIALTMNEELRELVTTLVQRCGLHSL